MLGALHYIFDRADRLAARLLGDGSGFPLVINFSFGFTGGPHGGRDRLEREKSGGSSPSVASVAG